MLAGRAAAWRACTAVAGALLRPQLTCKASVVLHQPAYHSTFADAFASMSAVRSFRAGCDLRQPSASLAARCAQARPAQAPPASLLPQLRVAQRWASTDSRRPLQAARDAVLKRLPMGVRSSAALTSAAPALSLEQARVCLRRRAAGQPRRSAPRAEHGHALGAARAQVQQRVTGLGAPGTAQKVLSLHLDAFWQRHGRKVIAAAAVVGAYFLWCAPRPALAAGSARERARALHGSGPAWSSACSPSPLLGTFAAGRADRTPVRNVMHSKRMCRP